MEQSVHKQLNAIKNIIIQTVPVEQIYLFGSHAYGTPSVDSDLDIYVVMPDNTPLRDIDASHMIARAIRDHKTLPADVLVTKKSNFQARLSALTLEQEVARRGRLLYG